MRSMLPLLLLLILAAPALALDGVLEINAACVADGCFSGDGPGPPVTIDGTAGSSYRMTSDLQVFSSAGVLITGQAIRLDLGGFAIVGPNACTGDPVTSCTFSVGSGLIDATTAADRASIRNGSLRGGQGSGVLLRGSGSVVEDVTISECGDHGVSIEAGGAIVRRVVSERNLEDGLRLEGTGLIESSTSRSNGGDGIDLDGDGGLIRNVTAAGNASDGVNVILGAVVVDSIVRDNVGDGIECTSACNIHGNIVTFNTMAGLRIFATSNGYSSNTMVFNTGGDVVGSGIETGGNICGGSLGCP